MAYRPPVADQIQSRHVAGSEPLVLKNSAMAALLDMLALAVSDLAMTPWEKRFACWLVERDMSRFGAGAVGFDIEETGWTKDGFEDEKRFVLAAIDAARRRHGWERLPYTPREESFRPWFERLRRLVAEFPADAVSGLAPRDAAGRPMPEDIPDRGSCATHGVLLHEGGCIVCNNNP